MKPFKSYSINVKGELKEITQPWVMGILNVTPDSFYAGSRCDMTEKIEHRVTEMVEEGADVIDIGAYSTRPGAAEVSAEEEFARLKEGMEIVHRLAPGVLTSVDTFRAVVAARCVEELGVDMVNDVSGGELDPQMFSTVARLQVPYIVMHMRGTPATMQQLTQYDDVTAEVLEWLARKVDTLHQMGVADVIADPGFGFSKTLDQNYEMLSHLNAFAKLDVPLLVGVSRKSMIYKFFGTTPAEALNGTTVLNTLALLQGTHILRVHDVKMAKEAVKLVMKTYPDIYKL
ncbi:MAG: dihydropteroate synthase [Muribaculaceae bacterium]|nr:dihydropteroate synthase [Muribaculaceae bacterium]